jgi:hypothetical protein
MDKMGRKRILLTDDQRRVLAVKGKTLGRKTTMELTTIVHRLKFGREPSRAGGVLC